MRARGTGAAVARVVVLAHNLQIESVLQAEAVVGEERAYSSGAPARSRSD